LEEMNVRVMAERSGGNGFSIISEYSNALAHSCGALMKPTQGKQ
jgi:hypothetical protein